MKAKLLFKVAFVLPLIIFVDYLIMALVGCATCLFNMGEDFYCGPFCLAGKIILALSAVFFAYYIHTDIKAIFKKETDGTSTFEKENIEPANNEGV